MTLLTWLMDWLVPYEYEAGQAWKERSDTSDGYHTHGARMSNKQILCLDFDGVLHSYASGWKGPRTIPDPPVPGALEFLALAVDHFEVYIYSSRSHQWFGRRAMKRWLCSEYRALASEGWHRTPEWFRERVARTAFADPWEQEVEAFIAHLLRQIQWPNYKPPASISIDDRCLTFLGVWPEIVDLQSFKPWNKREIGA